MAGTSPARSHVVLPNSALFKHLAPFALVLGCPVQAATVARYDFDNLIDGAYVFANQAEDVAPGLTAGPWSLVQQDGVLNYQGNPGKAVGGTGWTDPDAAYVFEIQVGDGQLLDITGVSFDERASGTGPTHWSLSIAGNPVASGATAASFASHLSDGLGLAGLSRSVPIALSAGGAGTSGGTWRIDNFTLSGQVAVVPLPASVVLFGSGLAVSVALVRRRTPSSRRHGALSVFSRFRRLGPVV